MRGLTGLWEGDEGLDWVCGRVMRGLTGYVLPMGG